MDLSASLEYNYFENSCDAMSWSLDVLEKPESSKSSCNNSASTGMGPPLHCERAFCISIPDSMLLTLHEYPF